MEKMINYNDELYVIETDNMDDTLNHLKNESISECLIYDLKNDNLYTYYNKYISTTPHKKCSTYRFSYGKKRDQYTSISIKNGIERITVWNNQNIKQQCIYDSKTKITCR